MKSYIYIASEAPLQFLCFKGTKEKAALCIPSCNKSANCKMVDGHIYAFVQWNNFQ